MTTLFPFFFLTTNWLFVGRRDILGAAETGSGKTLAFGLPILSGIMKLKEKAKLKNLDVYDIPFKKTSVKRKQVNIIEKPQKRIRRNKNSKKVEIKESSEGYSSGDESDDVSNVGNSGNVDKDSDKEIEIPLRKRIESVDEGSDSDREYVHLSEMFDSDDLASSDDENKNDIDIRADEQDGIDEVDKDETGIFYFILNKIFKKTLGFTMYVGD